VANSNTSGASIGLHIVVPETRTDWKVRLIFINDGIITVDGTISLGKNTPDSGSAHSYTNLLNAANCDLAASAAGKPYKTDTAEFSATKGDALIGAWSKAAQNEGAGNVYIFTVELMHD